MGGASSAAPKELQVQTAKALNGVAILHGGTVCPQQAASGPVLHPAADPLSPGATRTPPPPPRPPRPARARESGARSDPLTAQLVPQPPLSSEGLLRREGRNARAQAPGGGACIRGVPPRTVTGGGRGATCSQS